MAARRGMEQNSESDDNGSESEEETTHKDAASLCKERMFNADKNAALSVRAWVEAEDIPGDGEENGCLLKLYYMLCKRGALYFSKSTPLTATRLLRMIGDEGGNATHVQGLLVGFRREVFGASAPSPDEGGEDALSYADFEDRGTRMAWIGLIDHLRSLSPLEKTDKAAASRMPTGEESSAGYRIGNCGPSATHYGAVLSENRVGAYEAREKKHVQRVTFEKKQGGMSMPSSIRASREQCEEFGSVYYQSSNAAPSIPTLEKLIEKGGAMAVLDGRGGDYALSLVNAISALKTSYAGPAPSEDMTFDSEEGSCEIFYRGSSIDAAPKRKTVPAMLDVKVADELIVSVR